MRFLRWLLSFACWTGNAYWYKLADSLAKAERDFRWIQDQIESLLGRQDLPLWVKQRLVHVLVAPSRGDLPFFWSGPLRDIQERSGTGFLENIPAELQPFLVARISKALKWAVEARDRNLILFYSECLQDLLAFVDGDVFESVAQAIRLEDSVPAVCNCRRDDEYRCRFQPVVDVVTDDTLHTLRKAVVVQRLHYLVAAEVGYWWRRLRKVPVADYAEYLALVADSEAAQDLGELLVGQARFFLRLKSLDRKQYFSVTQLIRLFRALDGPEAQIVRHELAQAVFLETDGEIVPDAGLMQIITRLREEFGQLDKALDEALEKALGAGEYQQSVSQVFQGELEGQFEEALQALCRRSQPEDEPMTEQLQPAEASAGSGSASGSAGGDEESGPIG